jgi:sugar transferase (PEP-CTERM system associated)
MWRIFGHYIAKILLVTTVGDLAVLLGSVAIVRGWAGEMAESAVYPKGALLVSVTMMLFYLADLYDGDVRYRRTELCLRVGLASLIAAVLIAAISYGAPWLAFRRLEFLSMVSLSTLGLNAFRLIIDGLSAHEHFQKRVLVLGAGVAGAILSYGGPNGSLPFKILGFLDDDPQAHDQMPSGCHLLGKAKELLSMVERLRPDLLVVGLTNMRGHFPVEDILECRFRGVRVEEWTTFYEKLTGTIFVSTLRPSWLIFSAGTVTTRLTETLKRVLDITFAIAGLILSAPFMLCAMACIKLDSTGPILFRQERVGKHGKVFTLYKFRSMRVDAERSTGPVWACDHDPRITRVGWVLRKIRLDETPQMFNVLVGKMSFIGPRPERPIFVSQLKEQIPFYALRFSVKPGITGWAQVKYPYGSTVADALEKLQYDLYYVKNFSVFLDLIILFQTIRVILFGRGAR